MIINMKIVSAKSTDGIQYRGLLTEASNPKGIIIHIHGMSGTPIQETYYQSMHKEYPNNGWSFLAGEHRGTDSVKQFDSDEGVKIIGNTYEIFEDCIYDIQGWIDFAKKLGYKRIWLQSHSLGTSKTAYYINQVHPNDIEGLILLSPSDMIGLVHDPIGLKDHQKLLPQALKNMKEARPKQILEGILWDSMVLSAESYLSFFGDNAKDAIFNYGNSNLGWEVVKSINIPVLAITGTKDDGIVPVMEAYSAMNLLESQLANSPRKKTIVYENAEHSFEGFEDNIVNDVIDFINS